MQCYRVYNNGLTSQQVPPHLISSPPKDPFPSSPIFHAPQKLDPIYTTASLPDQSLLQKSEKFVHEMNKHTIMLLDKLEALEQTYYRRSSKTTTATNPFYGLAPICFPIVANTTTLLLLALAG